jgi:hypothetical protein
MYNISWNVNSYTPIEEFKLSFRKLPVSSPQALPGHQQPPPPQQQLQSPPNNRRPSRRVSIVCLLRYIYFKFGMKVMSLKVISLILKENI